jgi:predicted Zn-dependent protease with MMP-like domain
LVDPEEFEELVVEALDALPPALGEAMRNVAVVVEDESPPGGPELLGLYQGIPLTARGDWYAGVLPDRISIFRGPVLRHCSSRAEVVEQVRVTVVHEIAHHFGIDDDTLDDLGYG